MRGADSQSALAWQRSERVSVTMQAGAVQGSKEWRRGRGRGVDQRQRDKAEGQSAQRWAVGGVLCSLVVFGLKMCVVGVFWWGKQPNFYWRADGL